MNREEKESLVKLWGMIFGYPDVTLDDLRRIGIISMDKDGNPTGNRLANGTKNIVWLEDILPQKKKYFFGKKRKR